MFIECRLLQSMGAGAFGNPLGSIVVVGEKAYVAAANPDPNHPAIAVVDLRSFRARRIAIPQGYFDGQYHGLETLPNAAATSDGKYVVMVETESADGSNHLFLINTMSDRLVTDNVLGTDFPDGIVISSGGKSSVWICTLWIVSCRAGSQQWLLDIRSTASPN